MMPLPTENFDDFFSLIPPMFVGGSGAFGEEDGEEKGKCLSFQFPALFFSESYPRIPTLSKVTTFLPCPPVMAPNLVL